MRKLLVVFAMVAGLTFGTAAGAFAAAPQSTQGRATAACAVIAADQAAQECEPHTAPAP